MTKVSYKTTNNVIQYVEVSGHTDFGTEGNDIVCSAVSTCVITSENLFSEFGLESNVTVKEQDGFVSIECQNDNEVIQHVLNNMINILKELENQFPKNIKIYCIGG